MNRLLLVNALWVVWACSGNEPAANPDESTRSDTVVIDGTVPACTSCTLTVEAPIRVGSPSDEFIPRRVPGILRDSRGTTYLTFIGWGDQPTLQYDSAGRSVKRIGRTGSGPGEYDMASIEFIGPGDSLYLFSAERLLNIYGPDGVFVRAARLPGVRPFGARDSGVVLATRSNSLGDRDVFVLRINPAGDVVDSFPVFSPLSGLSGSSTRKGTKTTWERRRETRPVLGQDGFVWTFENVNYRLERFDAAGKPQMLIGLRVPEWPKPIMTVAEAESAAVVIRERIRSAKVAPRPVSDMARRPRTRTNLMVDTDGLLWVVRNVPAPSYDTIRFQREDMSRSEAPGELVIPREVEDRRSHTVVEVIDPRQQMLLARVTLPFLGLLAAPGYIGRVSQDDEGFYVVSIYPLRLRR